MQEKTVRGLEHLFLDFGDRVAGLVRIKRYVKISYLVEVSTDLLLLLSRDSKSKERGAVAFKGPFGTVPVKRTCD